MHDSTARPPLRHQARDLWLLMLALYVPAVIALLAAQYVSIRNDHSMSHFTRDPLAHFDGAPPSLGALSNLGVLLWAAAATVCLFTAAVLPLERDSTVRDGAAARPPRTFFVAFGLFTAWLCLDDLFLIHERLIPAWTLIPEAVVYGSYAAGAALLVLVFHRQVLQSDFLPLALAGALFAGSILADELMDRSFRWHHFVEDGAKLLGIVSWLAYVSRASLVAIRRAGPEASSEDPDSHRRTR